MIHLIGEGGKCIRCRSVVEDWQSACKPSEPETRTPFHGKLNEPIRIQEHRGSQVLSRFWEMLHPYRSVIREARRLESERKARVEAHDAEWRAANPDLVAKGVPTPPTRESMTRIGVHGFGGFYQP